MLAPTPTAPMEKEVNVQAFRSAVLYLRDQVGLETARTICKETGLPYDYLVDENNWVSMDWLNRFYLKLVEVTGNPNAPYESGRYAAHPSTWGALYVIARAVASPGHGYRYACDHTPNFNKLATFKVLRSTRNFAEISWKSVNEHPYVCDNRRGQLEALPLIFGLPPAHIEEVECSARGASQCLYRITWATRSQNLPAVLVGAAAATVGWFVAPVLGAQPAVAFAPLAGAVGFLGLKFWTLLRANRDSQTYNAMQSAKLQDSVHEMERKFDELRRAKTVIEQLNATLEEKVRERTAQLEVVHKDLALSYTKLQDLDRAKNALFSNITHEFRTPLTLILSPLDAVLEGRLGSFDKRQVVYFNTMYRNALKVLKLINDLLDLTKMEEAHLSLRVMRADVGSFVRHVVEHVAPLAERKEITVELELGTPPDDIFVDPPMFERVLVNLLANAIKFTDPGGRVTVGVTRSDDGGAIIEVRDTGIGIPAHRLESIFDRFSQVDDSNVRRYGGTGIGLALVKEIVQLHGGTVVAESVQGQGTAMRIALRRGCDHFPEDRVEKRKTAESPASAPVRSDTEGIPEWTVQILAKQQFRYLEIDELTDRRAVPRDDLDSVKAHTVLVCEDNHDMLQFLHLNLQSDFRVVTAGDGEAGWELAQSALPDIVVTDLMMPGIDGLELCRRIKSDPRLRQTPVLMLTARGDVTDRVRGKELGADEYLGKPFDPAEMVAIVKQLVRAREQSVDAVIEDRLESLDIVSAGLAHEIRNPLNQIRNALAVIDMATEELFEMVEVSRNDGKPLDADELEETRRRAARMSEIADRGVTRICETVDLMAEYARSGRPINTTPVPLDGLVSKVLSLVAPREEKDVHIHEHLAAGAELQCVPEQMTHAITNLIQNAIDAVPNDGEVWVRTWRDGDTLQLSVKDNGPGIAKENLAKIFTPFFSTKGPRSGMGIGLTVTHRTVAAAGGKITVNSEVGVGTEFLVTLPAATARARAARPSEQAPPAAEAAP